MSKSNQFPHPSAPTIRSPKGKTDFAKPPTKPVSYHHRPRYGMSGGKSNNKRLSTTTAGKLFHKNFSRRQPQKRPSQTMHSKIGRYSLIATDSLGGGVSSSESEAEDFFDRSKRSGAVLANPRRLREYGQDITSPEMSECEQDHHSELLPLPSRPVPLTGGKSIQSLETLASRSMSTHSDTESDLGNSDNSPFSSPNTPNKKNKSNGDQYCICRSGYDGKELMIQCESARDGSMADVCRFCPQRKRKRWTISVIDVVTVLPQISSNLSRKGNGLDNNNSNKKTKPITSKSNNSNTIKKQRQGSNIPLKAEKSRQPKRKPLTKVSAEDKKPVRPPISKQTASIIVDPVDENVDQLPSC